MLNSVVVHSITMPSVSGQVSWKEYSWLNRYEQPEHSHPSITPSCTLSVTLTFEHVIQSPDNCHDKKPQLHSFGKLCCNPYKHLVESVKMCAAWGQAMAGLARHRGALPAWAGTPHTARALHHGGLSSAPGEKTNR